MPILGRRTVLASGLALVSGCAAPGSRPAAASSTVAAAPAPSPSAAAPPTPLRWHPDPGDLVPEAKLAAVRSVEAAGGGQVLEAQYGGLLSDSASVLVVTSSQTFDVRVAKGPSGWTVTSTYPSAPGSPGSPSAAARKVLSSSRIVLPPAASADVAAGGVHDVTLEAMLAVSAQWPVVVSVVRSGHPQLVFGTNRPSDHPRGLAFDTWAIDGQPVVSPGTSASLVRDYMETLANLGSYNVGGPQLLGAAPQFFSDQTHHDHVHAGFHG